MTVKPPTSGVWGIDVSHWNLPPVDMPRMVNEFGMSFVIIKSNDGSLKTRYCAEHVAQAKAAGIPFGLYVWLYPNNRVSIDAQAAAWAEAYKTYLPALGMFIDAEWTTYAGNPANPQASDLRMAHDKLKALTGRVSATYTSQGYADTNLIGFDWTKEPLWIANYTTAPSPALPKGVTTYKWWQYTSQLDGATLDPNGNLSLDGNTYNGTAAEFAAEYLGEPMAEKWQVTAAGLNMRTQPIVEPSNIILSLPKGSHFWGVLDATTGWVKGTHYQPLGAAFAIRKDFYISGSPQWTVKVAYTEPVVEQPKITSIILDLAAGSKVTIQYSDGTSQTVTA